MSEAEAITKPIEAVENASAEEAKVEQEQPTVTETESKTEQTDAAESAVKTEETDATKAAEEEEKPAEKPVAPASNILKTTAKAHENPRSNSKFDPNAREIVDQPNAIRKQVEFYFGDWNFPQDKFMWESCGGAENKPVPVKTLHSFKRMRIFQPYSAVIEALKDSTFLEVSGEEGEEVVKRKTAYTPVPTHKAKQEAASVYVKGFGDEAPDTQFELEGFFANFGEVKAVKLRRTNDNLFKGSVFVTFVDEDAANKFLALDPAPKWKDHDLKIMSKTAYCKEKSDLIRQGKLEPNVNNPVKFYEGRDGKNTRSRDSDDWKKRRDQDQKNGFRDRRDGGRGRGGRGRGGRGNGRGNGRGGRGGRDNRDNRDNRDGREEHRQNTNDAKPRIQSTADESGDKAPAKRAREDDGANDAPAAKKVDVKAE